MNDYSGRPSTRFPSKLYPSFDFASADLARDYDRAQAQRVAFRDGAQRFALGAALGDAEMSAALRFLADEIDAAAKPAPSSEPTS